MRKIRVLTRKEEIDSSKITNCTAVIIDVLLATSTIAVTLQHGASEVIPVIDQREALQLAKSLPEESYILSGEKEGYTLDGFLSPCPVALLRADLTGKTIIFSTTNGTVAIKNSIAAKTVYTSSLLNGAAVAKQINNNSDGSSVLIVCGGNHGRFSLEDFLGAGYLISELLKGYPESWNLSDSAQAAFQFYQYRSESLEQALLESETGLFLSNLGYDEAINYAAKTGCLQIVPRLEKNRLVIEG